MILTELVRYYDRTAGTEGGPPRQGYAETPVVAAIEFNASGEGVAFCDLRGSELRGKSKKPQMVPRRMEVPQPPKRTVGIAAGFLCDTAGYLLGFDAKGKPERALSQFAAARALHEKLLDGVDDPQARALLAFFRRWRPEDAAALFDDQPEEFKTGWLVFRTHLSPDFLHEAPALRAAWETHFHSDGDGPRGQCLVSGAEDVAIALTHPAIKGVDGAQSSGAALVSFNQSAFTFFGKKQNLNAPISAPAAFAYTTALNHLLRPERRVRLGDMSVAVWAESDTPAENAMARLLNFSGGGGEGTTAEAAAQTVQDQLTRIAQGQWAADPVFGQSDQVRFFILGLAPNAARVQLRFFVTDSLGVLLSRLQQHCRDVLFTPPGPGARIPSLWSLARETFPKDQDGKARLDDSAKASMQKLHGDLLRAVITGGDYPQGLAPLILSRFRADGRLTLGRLGLLKACLNRHARIHNASHQEEVSMALDEANSQPGYVLGRLFALLERMQEVSREEKTPKKIEKKEGDKKHAKQKTIRHRFMASASTTPVSVFPYLLNLSQAHQSKAERDAKNIKSLSWLIESVTGILTAETGIPAQLSPHQQGLFFIGYHHQRQALFQKKTASAEAAAEADDAPHVDENED